ncbi:MAG TPA: hypothetical protein VGE01_06955 [Fimbriimonas sp.]
MGKHRPSRDLDSQMMAGCSVFVLVAFLGFFLSVWPFFVWGSLWKTDVLLQASLVGFLPFGALGAAAARKAGVPGAGALVASSLAVATFLFLRLEQVRLSGLAQQTPEIEYEASLGIWLPIGWILAACLIAALGTKAEKPPAP